MIELHVMQGRLLPPLGDRIQGFPAAGWREELSRAPRASVSGIEWIYETAGAEANPIADDGGVEELRELQRRTGTVVRSLVADWFMDRPLLQDPGPRTEELRWLLGRCAAADIERVVLPFVDASSLPGESAERELASILASLEPPVELHLETDLPPARFAALLELVDDPRVKANYDTGNSAALGYDPRAEFAAYGDRLGSVHVKDRLHGGATVPLGTGAADLPLVFGLLRERGWDRPLVLQVARGAPGDEVAKTAADARHVRELWERAG